MKYFVIFLVLSIIVISSATGAFAQFQTKCHFGDSDTLGSEIFAQDVAVKTFVAKYPDSNRTNTIHSSDPFDATLIYKAETKNEEITLTIDHRQNENGCYRPKNYQYTYNDGTIDITVRNTLSSFTEIINLIKSDNKTLRDFYPDDCSFVDLEYSLSNGTIYGICKAIDHPTITIQAKAYSDDTLEINIPIEMVYSLPSSDCIPSNDFFVFTASGEKPYDITPTDIGNLVTVELEEGANRITIAGSWIIPDPSPAQYCGIVDGYDKKYLPPLAQLDHKMKPTQIRCNEGHVLIQKYDGSPACVKEATKQKLIERGWTERKVDESNNPLLQKWTFGTEGEISSLYISEDDSIIAVGTQIKDTQKGMLYVLDYDGMLLWKKEFDSMIGHVDISNNTVLAKGHHLCGGGGGARTYCNYTAAVFDVKGNKKQGFAHNDKTVFDASLSPQGNHLVTNTYDSLKFFDLNSNKSWTFSPYKPINWTTFLTDSTIIVKMDDVGEIFALDNAGNKIWTFTTVYPKSYSWATSNDGKYFAMSDDTSPNDGNIYLIDANGNLLWEDNIGDTVLHMSFSGDNSRLLVQTNDAFMLYDLSGNMLWKNSIPSDLTVSSDGSLLVGITFNQEEGANITMFDDQGNIRLNHPVPSTRVSKVISLLNGDRYLAIADSKNKLSVFEINDNLLSEEILFDLSDLQESEEIQIGVIPTNDTKFNVKMRQGDSTEIPWEIDIEKGFTTVNFGVSIHSSSPKIESLITPTDPYSPINGIPPGPRIITIHIDPDTEPGNYTAQILGRGDSVHKETGWLTALDGKVLGEIKIQVIPSQTDLSIQVGKAETTTESFCVNFESEGSGTFCSGGPRYQKIPITVFSNIVQQVKLDYSTILKGGWVKFMPNELTAGPNGTTSTMMMAGYLVPAGNNPMSDKSLVIKASSENESTTTLLSVSGGTISVINDETSPISLSRIRTNSNGTNFSVSGVVYDPKFSEPSIPVKLSVLGLWMDGNIVELPSWIRIDIPEPSFILNATKPHHFMISAKTDNAPTGTYYAAINENINGTDFVELAEVLVENFRR